MIILYSIIALFSTLIWVVYFKMIRTNDLKKSNLLILNFLLGVAMYFLFQFLNEKYLHNIDFHVKNKDLNKFLVIAVKIGFLGEILKVIPFLIISLLFKSKIKDSIDGY